MNSPPHIPIFVSEILSFFEGRELTSFFDGTLGAGGHAEAILQAHHEINSYIANDLDKSALTLAQTRLQHFPQVVYQQGNYSSIEGTYDGILVDLGVSSMQLDQADRGFSFRFEGRLDMRMNSEQSLSAYEIVNEWSKEELAYIFKTYGEERLAKPLARAIEKARAQKPIETTLALKEVLMPLLYKKARKTNKDPTTTLFQALRIAVNGELDHLKLFLDKAINCLNPKGRLAIITFHSLEDRLVKQAFRQASSDKEGSALAPGMFLTKEPQVDLITKKACKPTEKELQSNPRSRSAKLRVVEKR